MSHLYRVHQTATAASIAFSAAASDEDMTAYIRAADIIRETFECAVIVCGMEGTRPRGHTSLTGAADAQLSVRRDHAERIMVWSRVRQGRPTGRPDCQHA